MYCILMGCKYGYFFTLFVRNTFSDHILFGCPFGPKGRWQYKLSLTQTGRSQSVQSVCFYFAIFNFLDWCNGELDLQGFSLSGQLASVIYENYPNCCSSFEIRRSFVPLESQRIPQTWPTRFTLMSEYTLEF